MNDFFSEIEPLKHLCIVEWGWVMGGFLDLFLFFYFVLDYVFFLLNEILFVQPNIYLKKYKIYLFIIIIKFFYFVLNIY